MKLNPCEIHTEIDQKINDFLDKFSIDFLMILVRFWEAFELLGSQINEKINE